MTTTMNMSNYEIEQEAMDLEYSEEILCSGWNPTFDLACAQLMLSPSKQQLAESANILALSTPDEISTAVSELFLRKVYSYQH